MRCHHAWPICSLSAHPIYYLSSFLVFYYHYFGALITIKRACTLFTASESNKLKTFIETKFRFNAMHEVLVVELSAHKADTPPPPFTPEAGGVGLCGEH